VEKFLSLGRDLIMKTKQNILCIFILCIIIVAGGLTACHSGNGKSGSKTPGKEGSSITTADYTGNSYTDIGLFRITENSMLMFQDASSGEKAYICDKANCEHKPYDEVANPEPECAADAHRDNFVLAYENNIYLIGRDKNQTLTDNLSLYQEDINGTNRKKLLTLDNTAMNLWSYGVCNGKYLAISYTSSYEIDKNNNITESETVKTGIILVDLSSKKIINKVLARSAQSGCFHISINGDKLYYVFYYMDDKYDKKKAETLSAQNYAPYVAEHIRYEYHCYNLNTEEDTDLSEVAALLNENMAIKGCELFYKNHDNELCLYNDETKEITNIYGNENTVNTGDYRPIGFLNEHLLYCNYKESGTEWYLFDKKTKKSKMLCTNTYVVLGISDGYIYAQDATKDTSIECFTLEQFQKLTNNKNKKMEKSNAENEKTSTDSKTVVWGISEITQMDTETENQINQYLKKKGYDFKVEFKAAQHLASAKEMKEKQPELDIVQTAARTYYTDSACRLIREKYFYNLEDYLSSTGKSLYNSVPPEKWKQVTVDGEIYTVPNTFLNEKGIYFAFNSKYISKKSFQEFDGTLQGMEKIVSQVTIKQKNMSVILDGLDDFFLDGLVGGTFDGGLYLSNEEKRAGLWFEQEDVKEVYETLHRLYSNGYIDKSNTLTGSMNESDNLVANVSTDNYVVCVGSGNYDNSEYYRENTLVYQCKKPIVSKVSGSIGVVNDSAHKEDALELLKLAYTDQKLANLMNYGIPELPEDSYTVKDGIITKCSEKAEYRAFDNGIEFGNYLTASPLSREKTKSRKESLEKYYKKYGFESSLLGFNVAIGDYGSTVKTLTELEMNNQDIRKSSNFEKDYQKILNQINTDDNQKFVTYINTQIKEWNDKVTK